MYAGEVHYLRRLCLRYFVRVSPALSNSFTMNAEHEGNCTFTIHVEELFDSVHDEFHWSVFVIQDQHAPYRPLGGIQVDHLLFPGSLRQKALSRIVCTVRLENDAAVPVELGRSSYFQVGHSPTCVLGLPTPAGR